MLLPFHLWYLWELSYFNFLYIMIDGMIGHLYWCSILNIMIYKVLNTCLNSRSPCNLWPICWVIQTVRILQWVREREIQFSLVPLPLLKTRDCSIHCETGVRTVSWSYQAFDNPYWSNWDFHYICMSMMHLSKVRWRLPSYWTMMFH